MLYDLREEDLARLRGFEGIAYDEAGVEVETAYGLEPARTFVARHPKKPRRPSARYLGVIIAGARHHGLPPEWIARLEAEPRLYVPGLHELWRGVWALADFIHRLGTRLSARR